MAVEKISTPRLRVLSSLEQLEVAAGNNSDAEPCRKRAALVPLAPSISSWNIYSFFLSFFLSFLLS